MQSFRHHDGSLRFLYVLVGFGLGSRAATRGRFVTRRSRIGAHKLDLYKDIVDERLAELPRLSALIEG